MPYNVMPRVTCQEALDFFRDFFHFFGGRAANQEFALVDDLPFHSQAPNPTFGVAGRTKRRFWNVRFGRVSSTDRCNIF
jgi:hypothetical protein